MYNRIKIQKIDVANESFGSEFLIFRLYTALWIDCIFPG